MTLSSASSTVKGFKGNGFKIFVVDDEVTIAFTLAAILRVNGYTAHSFTNPVKALEAAEQIAPHLVISDVVMPEMSGVDLAMRILAVCPECRILLFSGQAATHDFLVESRKAGYGFNVTPKPIHPQDLLIAVRQQLDTLPATTAA
jgi:DNA-binding NtrC family response regulator